MTDREKLKQQILKLLEEFDVHCNAEGVIALTIGLNEDMDGWGFQTDTLSLPEDLYSYPNHYRVDIHYDSDPDAVVMKIIEKIDELERKMTDFQLK